MAFPSSNLALAGTEAAVTAALAARAAGGTNFATASVLGPDIARIDGKATAWALIDVTRAQRLVGSPHVSTGSPAGAAATTKRTATAREPVFDSSHSLRIKSLPWGSAP